mgnify:CR=1 FL=1
MLPVRVLSCASLLLFVCTCMSGYELAWLFAYLFVDVSACFVGLCVRVLVRARKFIHWLAVS